MVQRTFYVTQHACRQQLHAGFGGAVRAGHRPCRRVVVATHAVVVLLAKLQHACRGGGKGGNSSMSRKRQ